MAVEIEHPLEGITGRRRAPQYDTVVPLLPAVTERRRRGLGLGEAFRIAASGLLANKLRSFLTMLGIIMGVAAVIVMVALGEGAAIASQEAIQKLGTNMLHVSPNVQRLRGVSMGAGTGRSLEPGDELAILRDCPSVKAVAPEYRDGGVTVRFGNKNTRTNVYGSTPNYFEIKNLPIAKGRGFTEAEVRTKARVAVIGDDVRRDLFGENPPVGKLLRINGQSFTVIGVTARRGSTGWTNRDDQVTMPISTAMRRLFGKTRYSAINVQAVSDDKMVQAEEEVYAAMAKAHRLKEGQPPDIRIFNQGDLRESAEKQGSFLTMLLSGIALVSLVVGGIGIMNIMLVSVTERTREIGIRKAIGAKRKDVLNQFLIESVTMSLVGGLLGIGIGVGIALWMGAPADEGGLGFPMRLSMSPIVMSFGFSAAVGIFFGIYPAVKASGLDPIVALRTE